MVKTCCVKNCHFNRRKLDEKLSLHRFPVTDAELMSKWLDFLGYGNDWKPLKHSAICSRHFKPSDFRVNTNIPRLLPNAVPTIKVNEAKGCERLPIVMDTAEADDDQNPIQEVIVDENNLSGDMEKICRLCGNEYKCTLKSIFNGDQTCSNKIFTCLHLNVTNDDHLPLCLCQLCETKLEEYYNFITKVEETQIRLGKRFYHIVDTSNTKEITVVETPYEIVVPISAEQNDSKIYEIIFTEDNDVNCCIELPKCLNNNTLHEYDIRNTQIPLVNQNFNFDNSKRIGISSATPSNIHINTLHSIDEKNLKIPIKMEMMTPCGEQYQHQPSKPLNKKIEILQDIKINPHDLDFKCFKTISDESLLKTTSVIKSVDKIKLPRKATKKSGDLAKMTLINNGMPVCKFCNERFISKYALNHHIKYLCSNKLTCKFCKKTFSCNAKLNAHSLKCSYTSSSLLKKIGKRRRKPAFVMKREIINNCSYLVGYSVRAKQKSVH